MKSRHLTVIHIMYSIQPKITKWDNNQENMTYSQYITQSTETNMEMVNDGTHREENGDDGVHREG